MHLARARLADATGGQTQKWSHGPLKRQHPLLRDVWFSITPRSYESPQSFSQDTRRLTYEKVSRRMNGAAPLLSELLLLLPFLPPPLLLLHHLLLSLSPSPSRRQVRAITWVRSRLDTRRHIWMFSAVLLAILRFCLEVFFASRRAHDEMGYASVLERIINTTFLLFANTQTRQFFRRSSPLKRVKYRSK